jgi:nucleoside 2-deoxyribosyltransferase
MKIYLAHATSFNFRDELYGPLLAAPWFAEHDVILPHRDPAAVMKNSRNLIESCDLVVAEASYPSTGMGIELGWAHAAGIPIVVIHRADSRPSAALGAVMAQITPYTDVAEVIGYILRDAKNFC